MGCLAGVPPGLPAVCLPCTALPGCAAILHPRPSHMYVPACWALLCCDLLALPIVPCALLWLCCLSLAVAYSLLLTPTAAAATGAGDKLRICGAEMTSPGPADPLEAAATGGGGGGGGGSCAGRAFSRPSGLLAVLACDEGDAAQIMTDTGINWSSSCCWAPMHALARLACKPPRPTHFTCPPANLLLPACQPCPACLPARLPACPPPPPANLLLPARLPAPPPAAILRICVNGTHPAPSGARLGRLRRRSVFVPLGRVQEGGGALPQTLVVVHRWVSRSPQLCGAACLQYKQHVQYMRACLLAALCLSIPSQ